MNNSCTPKPPETVTFPIGAESITYVVALLLRKQIPFKVSYGRSSETGHTDVTVAAADRRMVEILEDACGTSRDSFLRQA